MKNEKPLVKLTPAQIEQMRKWGPSNIVYTRCTPGNGYIRYKGHKMLRARAVWIEAHGDPGSEFQVIHRCGNAQCIDLEHLQLGRRAKKQQWIIVATPEYPLPRKVRAKNKARKAMLEVGSST
jgi:hypothetical protein